MTNAGEFAHFIKGLGFRVWLAKSGSYGFISDGKAERVLSFSFTDGGSLGGNYGPPSKESGTGWRMDATLFDLRTAADVRRALYAEAPGWTRRGQGQCPTCHQPRPERGGWEHYTTVAQHLATYGKSSGYSEV